MAQLPAASRHSACAPPLHGSPSSHRCHGVWALGSSASWRWVVAPANDDMEVSVIEVVDDAPAVDDAAVAAAQVDEHLAVGGASVVGV